MLAVRLLCFKTIIQAHTGRLPVLGQLASLLPYLHCNLLMCGGKDSQSQI